MMMAFPRQRIEVETVDVYLDCLTDIEPGDMARAVTLLIQNSRFFPTIAEIREVATGRTVDTRHAAELSKMAKDFMVE